MPSFQIPVLSLAVRFFSLFPASLPQPFHRCFPSVFTSGLFPFRSAFFRPPLFRFQLLSLLFFLSFSSRFRLTAAFPVPVSALASSVSSFSPTWFPVSSFRILVLGFADGFLSPFPDSLPQLFLRCLPHAFAFGLFPFIRLSFVRLFSGSGYSASVSSFPFLPAFASQWLFRCVPSALASLVFPVIPDLISHVLFPGSSYSASCMFPFVLP